MPHKTEYTIAFPSLMGGLNLSKEYNMDSDESPDMMNLVWKEGSLRSRRGQEKKYASSFGTGNAQVRYISHSGTA